MSWLDSLAGRVDAADLEEATRAEERTRKGAEHLLARGLSPLDLLIAKASYYRCPFVFPDRYDASEEAIGLVSEELMRRYRILPLFLIDDKLYAATADPHDLDTLEVLSKRLSLTVEPVVAFESDIDRAINRIYLSHDKMSQAIDMIAARVDLKALSDLQERQQEDEEMTSEAPAVQMATRILELGVHLGASDIHLEPFEKRVVLRYRVDGVLREYPAPPLGMYPALISRIKVAAAMDIAERRLPQDGRTAIRINGKNYDMRISIMPGIYGEAMVIRILSSSAVSADLSKLGFQDDILSRWRRVISKPHGIVLVTGPTGSGKSTTLYSTLQTIATPERKIITLEDPVEYKMDGILQIAVNADIGYTFAAGLRAILRHDPDVVLIGEIRDLESAQIAIKASLTGHLLLSTLHTNTAPLALTRLIDMGVQPYQVLASMNGVLAQRLLRKLCPSCKVPVDHPEALLRELGVSTEVALYGPKGCSACNDIGYRGRTGIHEVFEITADIREMDPSKVSVGTLIASASQHGYKPLRHSAIRRLEAGDTSLEEVLAVTAGD